MVSLTSAVILPDCLNFLEATSDVRQGPDTTSPAWGAERSPVPQTPLPDAFAPDFGT